MIRAVLVALCVAGCASSVEPPQEATVTQIPPLPAGLHGCPGKVASPPPPRTPRTVEAVVRWAGKVELSREATEAARAECARKLYLANEWAKAIRPPE
jgi:hypothetical protein